MSSPSDASVGGGGGSMVNLSSWRRRRGKTECGTAVVVGRRVAVKRSALSENSQLPSKSLDASQAFNAAPRESSRPVTDMFPPREGPRRHQGALVPSCQFPRRINAANLSITLGSFMWSFE
ncbi:hypothetical protein AAG570_006212 [Ranatra chinensis]|uniref:Uncharacterized protein n=1 Tax=Ranatra chinensis TaxID=642074 RepID=A0ABD0YTE7_9HEMI